MSANFILVVIDGSDVPPLTVPTLIGFDVASDHDESVITWDNPAGLDVNRVQIKLASEDDSAYSDIFVGDNTDITHTETLLTPGNIYSYRGRVEIDGVPSAWSEVKDIRATGLTDVLEEADTDEMLFIFKRKDLGFSDVAATTEITDTDFIKHWKDAAATGNFGTQSVEADAATWNAAKGRFTGVNGANEQDNIALDVEKGGFNKTFFIAIDYDASRASQRLTHQSVDSALSIRITSPTLTRVRMYDSALGATGNNYDIAHTALTTGDHVLAFVIEQDQPVAGSTRVTMYIDGVAQTAVSNATLDQLLINQIGSSGSQSAPYPGIYGVQIKPGILTAGEITTWTNRWAAVMPLGSEDWTPAPPASGGGTRPAVPAHLDDVDLTLVKPPIRTGAWRSDLVGRPFLMPSDHNHISGDEVCSIWNAVTAQKSAFADAKAAWDAWGVRYFSHISNNANQNLQITFNQGLDWSKAGEAIVGMAFEIMGLPGDITVGTYADPTIFMKHFAPTRASTLTSDLSTSENATCTITNLSWQPNNKLCFIYRGSHANPTSIEVAKLNLTGNPNEIRISQRAFLNTASYNYTQGVSPTTYIRTIGVGPSTGNTYNIKYNLLQGSAFYDGAGQDGAAAQAAFTLANIDKDKFDNPIANYLDSDQGFLGYFTDIDKPVPAADRNYDYHWNQTGNAFVNGVNAYGDGQLAMRQAILAGLPAWAICLGGTVNAWDGTAYAGKFFENITDGGQNGDGHTKLHGLAHHMQNLYMSQYEPFADHGPTLSGMGDRHGRYGAGTPSATEMNTHNFNSAACQLVNAAYGIEGRNDKIGEWRQAPSIPAHFVNVGQPGAAGVYGECIFPPAGTYTLAQMRVCKNWMGLGSWEHARVLDANVWSEGNAIKIVDVGARGNITDWTTSNCGINYNATEGAVNHTGWTNLSNFNGAFSKAFINAPDEFQVTAGQTYTVVHESRIGTPSDEGMSYKWGVQSQDQEICLAWGTWTPKMYTFKAKQSGTFRVQFQHGMYNKNLQIRKVSLFNGDANLWIRKFINCTVVVNGIDAPTRNVDLGEPMQRLILNGPNKTTYDPTGELDGTIEQICTLAGGRARIYVPIL